MKNKINASSHGSNKVHTFFMLESYDGLSGLVIGIVMGFLEKKSNLINFCNFGEMSGIGFCQEEEHLEDGEECI